MSEPTPTPSTTIEKTTVVTSTPLCRLWTLTIASLTLNGLILILLIVGAIIIHHHQKQAAFAARGGMPGMMGGGQFYAQGPMGPGHGWGNRGGRGREDFGGGRFGGSGFRRGHFDRNQDNNDDNSGPGMGRRFANNAPDGNNGGMGGGSGMGGGGMRGMMGGGMMGGGRNATADPAQMSDRMLNRLSNRLSLTDDEKAKLKPLIEAQITQAQKAMEDTRAKIKALLTPDQQKQFDAMQPQLPAPTPPAPAAH